MRRKMTAVAALAALASWPRRAAATEQQQRHHGRGGRRHRAAAGGASTEAPTTEATATTAAAGASTDALATLDKNGDGKVVFGVATPGPRDDGALLPGARRRRHEVLRGQRLRGRRSSSTTSRPPRRPPSSRTWPARTSTSIMVGAGEIADPLNSLIPKYPDLLWYCNCGAGYQDADEAADPVQRRQLGDQLLGGLRHRPPHEGRGPDEGRVHRQQQLQLRAGGLPGLRAGPRTPSTRASSGPTSAPAASTTSPRPRRRSTTSTRRVCGRCTRTWAAPTRPSSKLANEKGDVIVMSAGSVEGLRPDRPRSTTSRSSSTPVTT